MNGKYEIPFERLENESGLSGEEQELLAEAKAAWKDAYAPFSHFLVGCAIQFEDGSTMTGNNQENKAFPSGICAERSVLFAAGSAGKGKLIRKLAVTAKSLHKAVNVPVTPCGACRQVMLEYEQLSGKDIVVIMQGETGQVLRMEGVGKCLLPFGFDVEF